MAKSEFDRIKGLTDEDLLVEFDRWCENYSPPLVDCILEEIGRRKLMPPKRVPAPPTESEQRHLDDSVTILTTPKKDLFDGLFKDGRLGEHYDRAKAIHDEYGNSAEYSESLKEGVTVLLLYASETGDPEIVKKGLDALEGVLIREIRPLRAAGSDPFLPGAAFEMITFEVLHG